MLFILMGQRSVKMTCSVIKVLSIRRGGVLIECKFKHIPPLKFTFAPFAGKNNTNKKVVTSLLHGAEQKNMPHITLNKT